jgi:hypothetical protein
MWMEPAHPSSVMDDRATDTVHHPPQGKGGFTRWLRIISAPAGDLAGELWPHQCPAIVGRAQLVWEIIGTAPERPRFKTDYL